MLRRHVFCSMTAWDEYRALIMPPGLKKEKQLPSVLCTGVCHMQFYHCPRRKKVYQAIPNNLHIPNLFETFSQLRILINACFAVKETTIK